MKLPEKFLNRMREYLGAEYELFAASYSQFPRKGVRVNTLKSTIETVGNAFGGEFERSPFSPLSYYVNREKVGDMPLHAAGAFYSQEPSASSAVAVLAPESGDRVLDLCAAPGGKTTQIAACLSGTGLLWANEIVRTRANILLSNVERMGVKNAVISSCHPDRLCNLLAGFFDKVLVDAPCSGEGMFRKNPEAIEEWSLAHVQSCASRQLAILDSAASAVREGGVLVYSTCTFSKEENEDVCCAFLEKHPEYSLASPGVSFGRKAMGIDAVRILPMDGGEGHFVAKFTRTTPNSHFPVGFKYPAASSDTLAGAELYASLFVEPCLGEFIKIKDKLLILPHGLPEISGLSVLRPGVELGECRTGRIEPSHALFTCQKPENCCNLLELAGDERLEKFLHGEEISCPTTGFTAVSVSGAVVGFGKASGGMLKNRYPKGLRTK